jgi:hypothetical protein
VIAHWLVTAGAVLLWVGLIAWMILGGPVRRDDGRPW